MVIEKNVFENLSTESYGKFYSRESTILYLGFLEKGKGVDDVHKKLVIDKWTEALSKRTNCRWIELLEAGQLNTPREAVTLLNIKIVEDFIKDGPILALKI